MRTFVIKIFVSSSSLRKFVTAACFVAQIRQEKFIDFEQLFLRELSDPKFKEKESNDRRAHSHFR